MPEAGSDASSCGPRSNVIDVDHGDAAQKKFAREQKINARLFGHYRYMCVPTDESIQALRNRASPPNAVVIGRRDAGGWTFAIRCIPMWASASSASSR